MKRRVVICVVGTVLLAISGCGVAETSVISAHNDQQYMESSQESDDTDDEMETFSTEDIMSFEFEEEAYTIPFSYEQLQDKEWTVSPEMDEVYEDGEECVYLFMDNKNYDGIMMTVSSKTMSKNIKDTESLISELEENGVWGLGVSLDSVDILSDPSSYPDFEIKGRNKMEMCYDGMKVTYYSSGDISYAIRYVDVVSQG